MKTNTKRDDPMKHPRRQNLNPDDKQIDTSLKLLNESQAAGQTGSWEYDIADDRITWSDEMYRICGIEVGASLPGWKEMQRAFPQDWERLNTAVQEAIKGTPYEIDFRIQLPDGTLRWGRVQGTPIKDERGNVVRLIGTMQDITARKQAESDVQSLHAKYEKMIANIGDVIVIIDSDGINQFKSANIETWFGWRPEELVGRPALDNVHPNDQASAQAFIGSLTAASNIMDTMECRYRCKDGTYKWIEFKGVNLLHDHDIRGILGNYHDITERKQAEAEKERLLQAINQVAEAILITNPKGTIEYVNPAFEAITGYSRAEAIGQNPRMLQSGEHDASFYNQLWETLLCGDTWVGRFINKRKNGTLYTEEATISPVKDDTGEIVNYVGVKRDITEELKMEGQLRQSQKLESIGTLASGVAHEINNPIMGIMGYSQLIIDQLGPDHEIAGFATEIGKETQRVAAIVKNLLSFARHDKQSFSPARIVDIVESTQSLVRALIKRDQISLQVNVPENLPPIMCRSQQIQQVIMNLLANARDALNEKYKRFDTKKKIRITANTYEKNGRQWVRTTVEDFGPGISEAVRERMLDPFYTTKPRDQGTGLGLSISHGIVKEHGGEMTVESEVGQWTRFHVDLPIDHKVESGTTD